MENEEITVVTEKSIEQVEPIPASENTVYYRNYLLLPSLFLTVTLLGGLRIGLSGGEFVFVRPALIALVFAVVLVVLFVRSRLIEPVGWFSERFSALENVAAGAVMLSLYAASVQVFNSLLPEAGLPFWIVAFCFCWTLWNNLFAPFDAKRLLQSLGGLFAFAFVVKYMVLLNLSVEGSKSWWGFISSGNITSEAISYLLAIPPYAGATGYIQFFALAIYLIGLFLLKPRLN
ncbi:MAG: hypothetical protein HKN33_08500 [Pyrinomonadaceae bacterium]|nr:hypothetical protein [Pyrinomonadaceae bacterium]